MRRVVLTWAPRATSTGARSDGVDGHAAAVEAAVGLELHLLPGSRRGFLLVERRRGCVVLFGGRPRGAGRKSVLKELSAARPAPAPGSAQAALAPVRGARSPRYRAMASAALRPAAMAAITVEGPLTTSPPANTPGSAVSWVSSSALIQLPARSFSSGSMTARSARWPMARNTWSAAMVSVTSRS